jgi:chemotaxis regulatin CheY-phosphate phosphatase CheZ
MMDQRLAITEDDYLALEDALCANARGRAFLRMRDQRARVVAGDEVKRMLRSLTNSLKKAAAPVEEELGNSTHLRILRQELHEMSSCIQQTRSEVAALRPDDTGNNRIMAATGELDAIVTATERATGEILNAAERILALAGRLQKTPDTKSVIEDIEGQGIEILTACSFQDITGQRTTKVVNTLHYLEKRVNSMIEIWGVDALQSLGAVAERDRNDDKRPDSHLLNGPSLQGVSQEDVDALLADFNSVAPSAPAPAAAAPVAAAPSKPVAVKVTPAPPPATAAAPVAAQAPPAAAPIKLVAPAVPAPAPAVNGAAFNQNDIDALFD